jgi:hypothetical protein
MVARVVGAVLTVGGAGNPEVKRTAMATTRMMRRIINEKHIVV